MSLNDKSFSNHVKTLRKRFRILKDWTIRIDRNPCRAGHVYFHSKMKQAVIGHWGTDGKPEPVDYIFHELLHIALRAFNALDRRRCKEGRISEEELVQDICSLFRSDENGNGAPK